MNENIFWVLDTEIGEGKMEDLILLMTEMSDHTKANEPGTLNYEWFTSSDNKRCALFERYADSAAALVHLSSFMKNFAKRFMEILTVKKFVVYGNPSDEFKDAVKSLGVIYYSPLGGFKR